MSELRHWILVNKEVQEVDLMTWALWFQTNNRIVKQEQWGPFWVSTVFLGIDHNYTREGPPILFETMIFLRFGRRINFSDMDMYRCSTYGEAEFLHRAAMVWVRNPRFWWRCAKRIPNEIRTWWFWRRRKRDNRGRR